MGILRACHLLLLPSVESVLDFPGENRFGEDIEMGKEEEIKKGLLIPVLCHMLYMINTRQPAVHHEEPSHSSLFFRVGQEEI